MTSPLPLDELYLQWLYSQVADVKLRNPARTYWSLMRVLYKKMFVWTVPNDDNRVADGKDLRYEFFRDNHITAVERSWLELECSMLEMLVALSRTLAFEIDGNSRECFWHFMQVLGLDIYADNRQIPHDEVDDILDTVIWRRYRSDGHGGLFPLKKTPLQDQRDVELWYQLNAYLLELD